MSSGIQIYADKENVSQLLLDPSKAKKIDTPRPKLLGKHFNSSSSTAPVATRKVLGSLENKQSGIRSHQENVFRKPRSEFRVPAEPRSKPRSTTCTGEKKEHHQHNQVGPREGRVKILSSTKVAWLDDDIESMPQLSQHYTDDFDDIWPVEEQPISFIDRMRKWRPSCIFPPSSDSDDDDIPARPQDTPVIDEALAMLEEPEVQPELVPEVEIPSQSLPSIEFPGSMLESKQVDIDDRERLLNHVP